MQQVRQERRETAEIGLFIVGKLSAYSVRHTGIIPHKDDCAGKNECYYSSRPFLPMDAPKIVPPNRKVGSIKRPGLIDGKCLTKEEREYWKYRTDFLYNTTLSALAIKTLIVHEIRSNRYVDAAYPPEPQLLCA